MMMFIRSHFIQENRDKIIRLANNGSHYKYQLYMLFNPQLKARNHMRDSSNTFSKLCLSSHSMPIELGRWNRTSRENRLCRNCGVLGDEKHFIYHCQQSIEVNVWIFQHLVNYILMINYLIYSEH